jgi:hypothetical protein
LPSCTMAKRLNPPYPDNRHITESEIKPQIGITPQSL